MTIVVGLATPDGLVLATDSRTTAFPDASGHRNRVASDSADKLFVVCGRFAVATFGDAFIGERTIAGLMSEFIALVGEVPQDVAEFAAALGHFFHERYERWRLDAHMPEPDPALSPPLGFLVGGYDESGIGRFHEVGIPGPRTEEQSDVNTAQIGMLPRGQRDVIDRLLLGVDRDVLEAQGVGLHPDVDEALGKLTYNLFFPITLQDGIDFASFLIRTTVDMQRFSDGTFAFSVGVPGCGGPTRIAVVRRTDVEWVTPPRLRPGGRPGLAEGALD
jgi:hypothetical protein